MAADLPVNGPHALYALERVWTQSYEEDHDGNEVFRPETWRFPPSRGRNVLDLRTAKGGRQLPGPDDRKSHVSGTWTIDLANRLIAFIPDAGGAGVTYAIIGIEADRLTLKRR